MPSTKELPAIIRTTSRDEQLAHGLRVKALETALSHVNTLDINTGKEQKARELLTLITRMTGQPIELSENVRLYVDENPEPKSPYAWEIARHKALQPRRERQGGLGVVSTGQDINAFTFESKNGVMQPSHKYERLNRQLSEQEIEQVFNSLIQFYCFPEDGTVRVLWDLSTHIINGREYNFGDKIEVISKPVDPELMMQYLHQAYENGLLYKSNLHFAALECLVENGGIVSVSVLSREMELKGYTQEKLRRAPDSILNRIITRSVVTNVPVMMQ